MSKKNRFTKPDTLYSVIEFDDEENTRNSYSCIINNLQYYRGEANDFVEDKNDISSILLRPCVDMWKLYIDDENPWPNNTTYDFEKI